MAGRYPPINLSGIPGLEQPKAQPEVDLSAVEEALAVAGDVGAGVLSGIVRDPLVGWPIRKLADTFTDLPPEAWDDLHWRARSSAPGRIAETTAEWAAWLGPSFVGYGAGRLAAQGIARLASPAAAAYLGQTVGGAVSTMPKGLRAAEIVGGALGSGVEGGARRYAETGDLGEALESGAIAAGVVGGIEGALTLAAPLWKAVNVDPAKIAEQIDPKVAALRAPHEEKLADLLTQPTSRAVRRQIRAQERSLDKIGPAKIVDRKAWVLDKWDAEAQRSIDKFGQRIQVTQTQIVENEIAASTALLSGDVRTLAKAERMRPILDRTLSNVEKKYQQNVFLKNEVIPKARATETPFTRMLRQEAIGHLDDVKVFNTTVLPGWFRNWWQDAKMQALASPDTMGRRMGPTATTVVSEMVPDAAMISRIHAAEWVTAAHREWDEMAKAAHKVTGTKAPGFLKRFTQTASGDWARPIIHLYETPGQGIDAVRRVYGGEVAKRLENIMGIADEAYRILDNMGAEAKFSDAVKADLRVGNWFPHIGDLSKWEANEKVILGIMRTNKVSYERAQQIASRLQEHRGMGVRKVGSADYNRLIGGTLEEKITNGLPYVTDPRQAMDRFLVSAAHRAGFGQFFGPHMELEEPLKALMRSEGAHPGLVDTLMKGLLGVDIVDDSVRKVARTATNLQVVTKLGLAPMMNLTQTAATTLPTYGLRNTFSGMLGVFKRASREQILKATGSADSLRDALYRGILMEGDAPGDNAARFLLRINAFNLTEVMNRLTGGGAGMRWATRKAHLAATGKLRGKSLDIARREAERLGFSIDEVAKRGGVFTNDEATRIIYRAARETQFLPDPTRAPFWWNTPLGRVMTQFKNYTFQHSKWMTENVLGEAAQGNMKPLATVLSVYPVAGEFVQEGLQAFREKRKDRPHGLQRIVENFASLGAFGIGWSALQAAEYKNLESVVLGPTFGEMLDYMEAMAQPNRAEEAWKRAMRQPTVRLAKTIANGSAAVAEELVDAVRENVLSDDDNEEAGVSLESMRRE